MGFKDRLVNRLGYAIDEVQPFIPETQNRAMTAPSRESFTVSESSALSLIPVSRAIAVLETAIMQIPVEVERNEEYIEGPAWLEMPDIENNVSQAEWLGTTVVHLATFGNAFWKITRGPRGIVNVRNVHPSLVSIMADPNGVLTYAINGINYTRNEVVHIKLWNRVSTFDYLGEGPIQRHRAVLRSALDLHNYADNWFRSAAVPTGTLTTSEFLSADVAKQNKDAFIASQQERSVAVLSSGLKYDNISLNPEQAQFLENQKYMTRQIATMFGVPTLYMGMGIEGQGMTYVNGNEDRSKLYEDGLQQYIVRIEQAITDLLPRGQYAEFNLTEFLRPNQLARYQSYAIGIDKKFLTVDEVRALESLPATTQEMPNQPIA
jgi:HK97 family phage portal protein